MLYKCDSLDFKLNIVEHPKDKHTCIKSAMYVNGQILPYFFSMPNLLFLLEYSGRYDFFHDNTDGEKYFSDVITDDEEFWIWRTYFGRKKDIKQLALWNFE